MEALLSGGPAKKKTKPVDRAPMATRSGGMCAPM